ncbi:heat stress transcription factor A-5-like [Phalaenopsis equestris]|uniref:heat stress transcription factor A-5-like n=1 Tax=Phalaenopsis equestris TaxID=78828 RepID=UPI0009E41595|nr:heat stress transcription factor A-5-like [Phalaenopsis equestris]
MEQQPPLATTDAPGSSTTGPAPFLLKTYDMIDDSSTDEIVSWSSTNSSFIVWNPPEFSSRLLPTYFKHNNYSSFIRQLNTYGFHKIDPERWEFANEDFIKGQKHLLKNIHRRKPIHSHSQPPADAERAALVEEIENLQKEKARLQADSWRFKQQHSIARIQLEHVELRMQDMEQRQEKMVAFLQKAARNPKFVENIVKMAGAQDFSTLHRKRRLPEADCCPEISENSFCENSVNSTRNLKVGEVGDLLNQELCDRLKLGLCPSLSGNDWNEDNGGNLLRMDCLPLGTGTPELSDSGASFCPRKNSLLMTELDEGNDGLLSCHLDLTLASSSMQTDRIDQLNRIPSTIDLAVAVVVDQSTTNSSKEVGVDKMVAVNKREAGPATGRANDKFWEQFLTERPGSSETEEASSSLKEDEEEEEEEEMALEQENKWRNVKGMEQLTL